MMEVDCQLEPLPIEQVSEPHHLQRLRKLLNVNPFLSSLDEFLKDDENSSVPDLDNVDNDPVKSCIKKQDVFENEDIQIDQRQFYNFKNISAERKCLPEILLEDSSDSEDEKPLTHDDLIEMLRDHVRQKKIARKYKKHPTLYQEKFAHYGVGLLSETDRYSQNYKMLAKKKKTSSKPSGSKDPTVIKKKKRLLDVDKRRRHLLEEKILKKKLQKQKESFNKRKKLWILIARKEIPKSFRHRNNAKGNLLQSSKKISQQCQKEIRKQALRSQKIAKETVPRARRMAKEMLLYWKRFDKVEREHRKKAEKEALEQKRQDGEMKEMKRQQRKLNFLITQTELYAHFMSRKMKGPGQDKVTQDEILQKLDETKPEQAIRSVEGGVLVNIEHNDDYDPDAMKAQALLNAQTAVMMQEAKTTHFDSSVEKNKNVCQESFDDNFSLANPTMGGKAELPQPTIFHGKLKTYQLKGMNWLSNLYNQGINGILADEMGLGKTVQSIAFLACLAETQDIWGPFLVVAPASTLHNWQQEVSRFVPEFKVLPYWGNPSDRKSLRTFWNQKSTYINSRESAPFHILITSYQLIVQDVRYFQRIRWQYLVLDEAQAIKSSASVRWKILLGFNCRNRLLLTGTPIQNTMAELWALLHFIMPTLFDSHDEFNEWFSKDIESHAENKTNLDRNQLSRLHMILKPFMLRRVKKDVENELSEKIEIMVECSMSTRQRHLYQGIKNKISIEDLLTSSVASSSTSSQTTSTLMNLVMQFRKTNSIRLCARGSHQQEPTMKSIGPREAGLGGKFPSRNVCNHPELFERRDVKSPYFLDVPDVHIPKLVYDEVVNIQHLNEDKNSTLNTKFNIWNMDYIHQSLADSDNNMYNCFSFSRFCDLSPHELHCLFSDFVERLLFGSLMKQKIEKKSFADTWDSPSSPNRFCRRDDLWIPLPLASSDALDHSGLDDLIFMRQTSHFCAHLPIAIKPKLGSIVDAALSTTSSDQGNNDQSSSSTIVYRDCQPVAYPSFLVWKCEKAISPIQRLYCSSRDAAYKTSSLKDGTIRLQLACRNGTIGRVENLNHLQPLRPTPQAGVSGSLPVEGWSPLRIPDRNLLITDSGKLKILDSLLTKMKREGHRVLIYSQMTRMIDLLEEFMSYRKHKYMRLDGSSKISDRRDMVADFQSKSDIFVFLLSTRAGGLGINLTAADTVIFYDSDWNPTVDQQAMDRAHRLGQTKQVTVYRLVTKGSIEERILQRAKEKSEIQKIVISGGQFKPDALKPKEVVSLLLDDDEMEAKFQQKQAECSNTNDFMSKRPGRKRKKPTTATTAENSPMEVTPKITKSSTNDGCATDINDVNDLDVSIVDELSVDSTDTGLLVINEDSNQSGSTFFDSRPSSTIPSLSEPSSPSPASSSKRGRGRGRGRGSLGRGRGVKTSPSPRGRGAKSRGASLAAATAAAAAAASAAAYAAHGFAFKASSSSSKSNESNSQQK